MKRYYTVVYEIHDDEAFKRVASAASGSMDTGTGLIEGVRVTACGEGDCMTAYDALADTLSHNGHDVDECIREWCEENEISPEDAALIIG